MRPSDSFSRQPKSEIPDMYITNENRNTQFCTYLQHRLKHDIVKRQKHYESH